MIDVHKLWKDRFKLFIKDTQRYFRLIFNDHFKFVLLFAFGGGAYYYQNWLQTLPQSFPSAIIIALIVGIILTQSPIQTFLKEADLVFLLPLETKLKPYFKRSIGFSFMIQAYILILVLAALGPLYFHQQGTTIQEYIVFTVLFLFVKWINISIRWHIQFFTEKMTLWIDQFVRLVLNISFVYVLVSSANWIFASMLFLLIAIQYLYFSRLAKEKGVKWEQLIDMEAERMMTFYRIANMFTDVPKYKERVHHRKWLNWLADRFSFKPNAAFSYLYYRTFTRSSDYFGIYVRLVLIGAILLYYLPLGYSKLLVVVLFIYLTGFQLVSLARHHSMKLWIDIYPIPAKIRKSNFLKLLFEVLLAEICLLTIVIFFTGDILLAFLGLGVGLLFTYYLVFHYFEKKIKI